jgi:uncharacterized paraquat-inducible protein A
VNSGTVTIACGRCGLPQTQPLTAGESGAVCLRCEAPTQWWAFPALLRETAVDTGGKRIIADESACFYHAERPARVVCDGCGRFLCSLCDVDYRGRHVCVSCLESGLAEGGGDTFRSRYVRYDNAALALVVLPVLFFPFWTFTIFTAPVAIFLAIYYWREPVSALPRKRWRMVLAIVIGVAQLGLWAAFVSTVFFGFYFNE